MHSKDERYNHMGSTVLVWSLESETARPGGSKPTSRRLMAASSPQNSARAGDQQRDAGLDDETDVPLS